MANQEHLKILYQGVDAWNQWRNDNSNIEPDLSLSDLNGINIQAINLEDTNLGFSKLQGIVLRGANLSGADLNRCDLSYADLREADLTHVNFSYAIFDRADLTNAGIGWTAFANSDLSTVKGLETLNHIGPTEVSISTIYQSKGNIPATFLRKTGVPDNFIEYMASLTEKAFEFYTCFLSHAEPDSVFTEYLRGDLLLNGVNCWHYRYDMRGGKFWRVQIREAIKLYEKLILVCSKESLQRRNVVDEIIAAMEQERESHSQKLFPIRLDDFILSDQMLKIADEKMAAGEWREDWVRYIRAYHIPSFRLWKDHDAYSIEFNRLLDALKNPGRR